MSIIDRADLFRYLGTADPSPAGGDVYADAIAYGNDQAAQRLIPWDAPDDPPVTVSERPFFYDPALGPGALYRPGTSLHVSTLDALGEETATAVELLTAGDSIRFEDPADLAQWWAYTVTAAPTLDPGGTFWNVPITSAGHGPLAAPATGTALLVTSVHYVTGAPVPVTPPEPYRYVALRFAARYLSARGAPLGSVDLGEFGSAPLYARDPEISHALALYGRGGIA